MAFENYSAATTIQKSSSNYTLTYTRPNLNQHTIAVWLYVGVCVCI